MYLIILCILSSIPMVDIIISSIVSDVMTYEFSYNISKNMVRNVIIVNLAHLFLYYDVKMVMIRSFVELIIINFLCKWCLDRERPISAKNYTPIYEISLSKNFKKNQSFPSGHVAGYYLNYLMFKNYSYWMSIFFYCLTMLVLYARINLKKHYLSDCLFAILISEMSFNLFYLKYF